MPIILCIYKEKERNRTLSLIYMSVNYSECNLFYEILYMKYCTLDKFLTCDKIKIYSL